MFWKRKIILAINLKIQYIKNMNKTMTIARKSPLMNKKQIVTQYQDLYTNLYSTLDQLKELMEGKEYQNLVLNPEGDEDVEMMYGEFGVLVDGIGVCYR
jgi:hypothetical protein